MTAILTEKSKICDLSLISVLILCPPISVMAAEELKTAFDTANISKFGNVTLDIKPKNISDAGYEFGDVFKGFFF